MFILSLCGAAAWTTEVNIWEARFPHVPTAVGSGWRPHRQGCGSTGSPQVGKPGFPVCSHQELLKATGLLCALRCVTIAYSALPGRCFAVLQKD